MAENNNSKSTTSLAVDYEETTTSGQQTPADDEIEEMKRRVKQMEAEAAQLREMQSKLDSEQKGELAEEVDSRSIFVNNVDYAATPEELQAHFQSCGTVNRVTILCDKWTGSPKGHAYIEFSDASSVANAMVLNESLFRGRLLQVSAKRTNVPNFRRGRGRGRGGSFRGSFRPRGRGRGRGRGYAPY